MKKKIILLIMAAFCTITHAQSALFNKYENQQDVTTVVVSKTMFRMMPSLNVGNRNMKKIASKIDQLKVMTCERNALITKISSDAKRIFDKKPWEEVMRYKEGNNNTIIYMQPLDKGKYEYSLYNVDKGELEIISIIGNLTLQEIQSITE